MPLTRVVVIAPDVERRANLADLMNELPGIEVIDAVAATPGCEAALFADSPDVLVAGDVRRPELALIAIAAKKFGVTLVEATTDDELVGTLAQIVARAADGRRSAPRTSRFLREYDRRRDTHTIDLSEWLPALAGELELLVPLHIKVVPLVAGDMSPVRCVPAMLEDAVREHVMRATTRLPWGGTVWITATPGVGGDVEVTVLENGRGDVLDLVLHASMRV